MNQKTIDKIKANPHYKPSPGQLIPDGYEEEEKPKMNEPVKTYGVPPIQHTVIEKHPTSPRVKTHKKKKAVDN